MSHLPKEAIREFQILWKKHCDEDLAFEEASLKAHDVFAVLRLALENPAERGVNDEAGRMDAGELLHRMRHTISVEGD